MDSAERKKCTNCTEEKPLGDYYTRTDGNYHNQCKQCIQLKQKIAREKKKALNAADKECVECKTTKPLAMFPQMKTRAYDKCLDCCNGVFSYCKNCDDMLTIDKFYTRSDNGKLRSLCAECWIKDTTDYVKVQKETNLEAFRKKQKDHREKPENKVRQQMHQKEWYEANKKHKRKLENINRKKQRAENAQIKPKEWVRRKTHDAWKGLHHRDIQHCTGVDCTRGFFKVWIEFQFDAYMTRENYGTYWNFDHVKPCTAFDLTDQEQKMECTHWTNVHPVCTKENCYKYNKYDKRDLMHQEIRVKAFLFKLRMEQTET